MAIKFSLPKKKAKNATENSPLVDYDTTLKPKKSLFAKRKPKTPNLTQATTNGNSKKLDKKSMTLIGALLAILVLGAVIFLFVLPMLSEPEPTPAPAPVAIAEPVAEPTASAPTASASTATTQAETASQPTESPASVTTVEAPTANATESEPMPTTDIAIKTENDVDVASSTVVEQKFIDKPQSNTQNNKQLSYEDFVKASEKPVFADR